MGLIEADWVKRGVLRVNRLLHLLHSSNLVVITKDDLIRFRSPGYRRAIRFGQEGHDFLAVAIARNEPLMVARLGAVELKCLRFYLEKRGSKRRGYPREIMTTMFNNAGFFPVDDASLDAFAELYLAQLEEADIMGVWFNQYENEICNRFCTNAELIDLDCFEPFRFSNPWSAALAGQKVLVVHPFVESIRKQYEEKRQLLFNDPGILPEFDLITYRAVQSIAGSKVAFASWFEAYRHMCEEISRIDFDICLIGAGAYGLPLAHHVKQLGKLAIQMGGVTQIMFGIKGKRWEREYVDTTAKLFNEHWVRPLPAETPAHTEKVDKGCYW